MDRKQLEKLLSEGHSVRNIGRIINSSQTNVRYWMNKFSLRPNKWVRTHVLLKEDVDKIKNAIQSSKTYGEALVKLNQDSQGSRYKTLKRRVVELNLNTSHFLTKSEIAKLTGFGDRIADELIFCENSKVARHTLKKRILENNIIEYKCHKCGQNDMWYGEKITLVLDHINGINNDNRKKNLRFVCPNCEATLPTHCVGHKKKKVGP